MDGSPSIPTIPFTPPMVKRLYFHTSGHVVIIVGRTTKNSFAYLILFHLALIVKQGTYLLCQGWQDRVLKQGVKPCKQKRADYNTN